MTRIIHRAASNLLSGFYPLWSIKKSADTHCSSRPFSTTKINVYINIIDSNLSISNDFGISDRIEFISSAFFRTALKFRTVKIKSMVLTQNYLCTALTIGQAKMGFVCLYRLDAINYSIVGIQFESVHQYIRLFQAAPLIKRLTWGVVFPVSILGLGWFSLIIRLRPILSRTKEISSFCQCLHW